MKKLKTGFKILIVILVILLAGGIFYWQYHKKHIIKDAVQHTVANKTDSLYFVGYDSSDIDEINGNVAFYNVVLQSDSMQRKLITGNDSLPNVLFNIHVEEVSASGIDVPGLLSKETVSANTIFLKNPVIKIIKTGHEQGFTIQDTLALYKKIIGNFSSIRADAIKITGGELEMVDKEDKILTSLHNINIDLNNFLIDSTKNYNNIVSYFIKDVKASVQELKLPVSNNSSKISLNDLEYDAANKFIKVGEVKQYSAEDDSLTIDLKKIIVHDLNTDAFINLHQIKAGSITCDGGMVAIDIKQKQKEEKKGDPDIEFSGNFFNEAEVRSIKLSNTKFVIVNKKNTGSKPFILNNVKFNVAEKVNIYNTITLGNLIDNTQWNLSFDAFSFITENKVYKVTAGPFNISNGVNSSIEIGSIQLKPIVTETAYGNMMKMQKDLYNFEFNHIRLTGINVKDIINESKAEINDLYVEPQIRIFNDRTLPGDNTSRQGTFPPESLLKIPKPVFIKNIHVINGLVSYREKSSSSALVGNVLFTNINATVSNITNIPEKIAADPLCVLNAKALFLDKVNFSTTWKFPLNTKSGKFSISGVVDSMDAKLLNDIIKPLALMEIKDGHMDKLVFDIDGSEAGTTTDEQLLYHNLDMNILQKRDDVYKYKKKELPSLIANLLVKNSNPENDDTREVSKLPFGRDYHKPFFNVVWNSIYSAAKKIALGKTK